MRFSPGALSGALFVMLLPATAAAQRDPGAFSVGVALGVAGYDDRTGWDLGPPAGQLELSLGYRLTSRVVARVDGTLTRTPGMGDDLAIFCTDTRRECSRGHTPELLRGVAGSVLLHLSPTSRGYLLLGAGAYQGSEYESRTPTTVGLSAGIGRDISRSESGRVRVSVEARYLYFPDLMVGARGVLPVVLRLSF